MTSQVKSKSHLLKHENDVKFIIQHDESVNVLVRIYCSFFVAGVQRERPKPQSRNYERHVTRTLLARIPSRCLSGCSICPAPSGTTSI
jgi:hypothetical protein